MQMTQLWQHNTSNWTETSKAQFLLDFHLRQVPFFKKEDSFFINACLNLLKTYCAYTLALASSDAR